MPHKIQPSTTYPILDSPTDSGEEPEKSGLLSLHRGNDDFSSLGGLASLKAFCKRSMLPSGRSSPHKQPRGVLLLGVPGTGKSAFAKTLGNETNRPTLVLDIGALMGSLVGQTENNIRQALRIADAMAPCILFCDEIEKALSGAASVTVHELDIRGFPESRNTDFPVFQSLSAFRSDVAIHKSDKLVAKLQFGRSHALENHVFYRLTTP